MGVFLGNVELFPQGDGPDIQLKVFGDEFYGRYETPAGYTVAYDPKKEKYCYAMLEAGHLVSSGIPTDQPAPDGLAYHIQEDKTVRNEAFARRKEELEAEEPPPPGIFTTLKIKTLRFLVDISHTWRGDLEIELITPHGSIRVKKPDARDSRDDWRRLYTIRGLEGKPMAGNWTLKVADVASGDIGVLDSWRLIVGYTS
uniref:Proprotein convertase P-domain-containing protein n=1 Tax=Candidatus Kentrum sp. UNK TaxID=2126344 RepID=A0A451A8U8_9GAMM|nr:MAG: Proprotein convertase P-domain-containing protein [Candidatus Kentron sp. UNK]VFK70506.1 MAG: Proprotein convertase P-domain-containing protein [Candidatus Kentron sp. UNK]